jgi:hypothetical protein
MKKLKLEDVIANVKYDISKLEATLDIVGKLKPIIEDFDGKRIGKKFTDKATIAIGEEYNVRIENIASLTNLIIFHNNPMHMLGWEGRITVFLGYSNILDSTKVIENYSKHYFDGTITKALNNKKDSLEGNVLFNMVTNWNIAVDNLYKVSSQADQYAIQYPHFSVPSSR